MFVNEDANIVYVIKLYWIFNEIIHVNRWLIVIVSFIMTVIKLEATVKRAPLYGQLNLCGISREVHICAFLHIVSLISPDYFSV